MKTIWCCFLFLWDRISSSLIDNFASCYNNCCTFVDLILLCLGDNLVDYFRVVFALDIQYSALCPFLMSSIVKHLLAVVKSSTIFVCSLMLAVLRQTVTGFLSQI